MSLKVCELLYNLRNNHFELCRYDNQYDCLFCCVVT